MNQTDMNKLTCNYVRLTKCFCCCTDAITMPHQLFSYTSMQQGKITIQSSHLSFQPLYAINMPFKINYA